MRIESKDHRTQDSSKLRAINRSIALDILAMTSWFDVLLSSAKSYSNFRDKEKVDEQRE